MADCDLLIIGAGVSGLSMAHYAAGAGLQVQVLEESQRAGGCLHSHRFTGALDGFWLELGAHSSFNSYGNLLAILERCQLLNRLQRRARVGFRLFADGVVHSIPSQLYWPELFSAPFRLIRARKEGRNVADYFGSIVGRRNYAAVFEPAFNAVICQPANDFPANCLFRSRSRRKDIPRSFTLAGGLQTITDSLSQQSSVAIRLGCAAREIRRDGQTFIVRADGGDFTANALCLATPVAVTARLLQTEFPDLAALLACIRVAEVESVGVAVPASLLKLPPLAGLIGRNETFYSMVSRDILPDPTYRGFTFHFRPGALNDADKPAQIKAVLELPHTAFSLENYIVKKINQLPALRVGHADVIRTVDHMLSGGRLTLTGNYFTGVAIEDCVTRSRAEFERLQRESGEGL